MPRLAYIVSYQLVGREVLGVSENDFCEAE